MTSSEIRQQFLDFFKGKGHEIVPSAPIVIKNDPTLMFTNAGMNQFKDFFLGNKKAPYPRVADTQKCLRVSGKHNDLEEVGVDTYHHTMFEMLGNWSFGDPARPEGGYFKKEAIAWSWELLTEVFKIDKDRLYVTVFKGDEKDNLPKDEEAENEWRKWLPADRILPGDKKDNFWEMGDTGPCGPCTEIHVDSRSDEERTHLDGKTLVNADHPQVIEIWNNVFIQFNRLKDGTLQPLPAKHVDTGMGFERMVRILQNKRSNYDTDVFTGTIEATQNITGKKYNKDAENSPSTGDSWKEAVAFRVIADHIRAISFTIADGQLPSNTGAGYVIRRILRRAVRYYYSYLDYKQPLLHQLVPVLAKQFETVFPELNQQKDFVAKVVKEEEDAFLRTVASGIDFFYKHLLSNQEAEKRFDAFLKENDILYNRNLRYQNFNIDFDFYIPEKQLYFELKGTSRKTLQNNELADYVFYSENFKSIFFELGIKNLFNKKDLDFSIFLIYDILKAPENSVEFSRYSFEEFLERNKINFIRHRKSQNEKINYNFYLKDINKTIEIRAGLKKDLFAFDASNLYILHSDEILTKGFKSSFQNLFQEKSLKFAYLSSLSGNLIFELYDTYGFPFDLTQLLAKENETLLDETGFKVELEKQKNRSRAATAIDTEDWTIVSDEFSQNEFVGYDSLEIKTRVVKYRKVKSKGKESYQIVLEATPFYAESGGQVGDTGQLIFTTPLSQGEGQGMRITITDTKKENNLIIHYTDSIPQDLSGDVVAKVDISKRRLTEVHHSATHLLHAALRKVLGTHVQQKGSLVDAEHLRFDFSHFAKMTDEEILNVEALVNEKIRENIPVVIREMPKDEALKMGAMALFGEKYGDVVRVVIIDPHYSIELCGGTHVGSTGELGFFRIKHETAIAAGVRRIEAVCGKAAEELAGEQFALVRVIRESLKNPKDLLKAIENLSSENTDLKKKLESFEAKQLLVLRDELIENAEDIDGINFIGANVNVTNADALKKLCFEIKNHFSNYAVVLVAGIEGKAHVAVMVDDAVATQKNLDAGKIIKEQIAPLIKGGGGGQKTLATAGGQDASNLDKVIEAVKKLLYVN